MTTAVYDDEHRLGPAIEGLIDGQRAADLAARCSRLADELDRTQAAATSPMGGPGG